MQKANTELRELIANSGLHYWQIAVAAGISAGTLTVWMRTPLTPERQERVNKALEALDQYAATA